MRPYGRRKNRLRASGRVINSTGPRVCPGAPMHTPIRNETPSLFAHSHALQRTEIGGPGTYAFTQRSQAGRQARRVRFFTRFTWTTPVEV